MDQVVQSLQSLSVDTEDSLSELEDILKYKFKSKSLLKEAITHSSNNNTESYEKLEFVGDSVLGYLVTKHLYCAYPKLYQGTLTLLRSRNVDTEKFARVCVKHKFHQYLLLNAPALQQIIEDFVKDIEDESKSFRCGDFKPPKVLADIVESIAGAVFVDCIPATVRTTGDSRNT
uniref:RNase III domain-containing protein n=1 Tax=Picea sitchensis TaxID=3332 RepID=D5AC44_PICSI|nr:unknown [Picea sitchensis]